MNFWKKRSKPQNKKTKHPKFIGVQMFKKEIFNSIYSHPIKLIRYIGILFIPFLYGFTYIFAFNDPLSKTNKLDFTIIASKNQSKEPILTKAMEHMKNNNGKEININTKIMSADDIYKRNQAFQKEINKHYVSIALSNLRDSAGKEITISQWFKNQSQDLIKNLLSSNAKPISPIEVEKIASLFIQKLMQATSQTPLIEMFFNNKKNFLIAFGASTKAATNVVYVKMIQSFLELDESTLRNILELNDSTFNSIKPILTKVFKVSQESVKKMADIIIIKNGAQMEEHSKYGFGLAPFFVSMGLWVGGIATILFINGKVYREEENKTKLYFVKLSMVFISNLIQTTILFLSLLSIGFYKLGAPIVFMYFTSLIISMLFTTVIFSIRFMIPSRVAGIIMVVFFLIAQMATSGGLFPLFAQSKLIQGISNIMPLKYAVSSLRESMFETNYLQWFKYLVILWSITIPFQIAGPIVYTIRKNKQFPIKAVK